MPTAHQTWGPEDFNEEDFEPIKTSRTTRVIRIVVAMIAIVGILSLSGLYQYSFFRRTPQTLSQTPVVSTSNLESLTVPLSIQVVRSRTPLNSSRGEENVRDVVADAQNIWLQAGINLEIESINYINLSISDTLALYAYPNRLLEEKDKSINVFFTRTLGGLNGIAYGKSKSITIADYTANHDFRVLAHEIGHILGLPHIQGSDSLMNKGANGFVLSPEEILVARSFAKSFSN